MMNRGLVRTKQQHIPKRHRNLQSNSTISIRILWIAIPGLLSAFFIKETEAHHMKKMLHHMMYQAMMGETKKHFLSVKGILVPIPIPINLPSIKFMKGDGGGDKGDSGGEEKVKIKYIPVPVPMKGGWSDSGGGGWSKGGGGGGGGGWQKGGSSGWPKGGGKWSGSASEWTGGGGGWEAAGSEWPDTGDWEAMSSGSNWKRGEPAIGPDWDEDEDGW